MLRRRRRWPTLLLLGLFALVVVGAQVGEAGTRLGSVAFPTSGSGPAQAHFLRGVAALHSFWYEEALESFQAATRAEPGFAMGYWGQAMTHNHPVWEEEDIEAGRAALRQITERMRVTERERGYIDAAKLLYGDGNKRARDEAYSSAMKKLYSTYPQDLEAACFYALSLLGLAEHGDDAMRLKIRAGAITLDVFSQNPNHPCAAHYTIHAFDDPDHAILALPAARRYADIAPESHHAQHMPAHIFLRLGMWREAARSNEAGWRDSVAWVAQKGYPPEHRDYHSLQWLQYVYLQQGRYKEAERLLQLKWQDMQEAAEGAESRGSGYGWRVGRHYEQMAAALVVETQRWELADAIEPAPGLPADNDAQALLIFVRGLGVAMRGLPEAEDHLAALRTFRESRSSGIPSYRVRQLNILELEVAAAIAAKESKYSEAISLMENATELEETLRPPSGPPRLVKPTHELYGEILLAAGKPKSASEQFAVALRRHPNRARSLIGSARAARQVDRDRASDFYSTLLAMWDQADPDVPGLREAREYLNGVALQPPSKIMVGRGLTLQE